MVRWILEPDFFATGPSPPGTARRNTRSDKMEPTNPTILRLHPPLVPPFSCTLVILPRRQGTNLVNVGDETIDVNTSTRTEAGTTKQTAAPKWMRPPSLKPALFLLGIILFILAAGMTASALDQPSTKPPSKAQSARIAALSKMVRLGQPPDDILEAVPLPPGAKVLSTQNVSRGIGLYSEKAQVVTSLTTQAILPFYNTQLKKNGWSLLSKDTSVPNQPGMVATLAKHPSSDGYYWEIGVIAPKTSAGAVSGSSSAGSVFTLSLSEISFTQ